ncbi:Gfo/Idh/MocA family protein [Flavobacterium sp. PS2]|uniref:Gfo/Idh/MocA family protein n=1 Tax=Flavobacterium sp. PS2 TaxID=3384157 RepID=UPI00390C8433
MEIVRWGIIGCGNVTEVKSGPAFQKAKNSALVAVMRRDAALAEDYAKRHNVPKWYSNAADLINDPDVDAVYIATPPSSHKEYALLCAKAGKPVYVEKPMALNFEECNEMISACKEHNVPLFVAYYRRCLPRFLKIKELIDNGIIGTPRHVNCVLYHSFEKRYDDEINLPWTVLPHLSGGGIFVDLACHTLDFLDFVFGPIKSVRGHATSQLMAYPAEDSVSMSFLFENGIHGTGLWNFGSHRRHDIVEIVGDKGKISFSTFGNDPITLEDKDGKTESFPIDNPLHIQQPLIETIVQELLGTPGCPSHGVSAARTTWVIDEVLKEFRQAHLVK